MSLGCSSPRTYLQLTTVIGIALEVHSSKATHHRTDGDVTTLARMNQTPQQTYNSSQGDLFKVYEKVIRKRKKGEDRALREIEAMTEENKAAVE
jgi:hypothetical protein